MLNRLAFYITDRLIENGTIALENKDIYQYGFEMGFAQVINVLTTLIIGFSFRMPLESILFLLSFMTLRTYAGGYHSSSHLKCYILSVTATVVVFTAVKLIVYAGIDCFSVCFGIVGIGLLIWFAPVEDRNKPMDEVEKVVFRKRAMRNMSIWFVITAILFFTPWRNSSITLCISIFVMGVTVVGGMCKNRVSDKKSQ